MKLSKTTTAALTTIWTSKTAYGARTTYGVERLTRKQAASAGYGWMNFSTSNALEAKGLVRTLVTRDEVSECRILVLVLTDLGRAQLGV